MTGDGRDGTGSGETGGSPGFDVSVAHPARVYNFLLGGKDNFAADHEAAHQMIAGGAKVLVGVRANRAFLGRAVRFLAEEAGLRQFLDIGTGLPTRAIPTRSPRRSRRRAGSSTSTTIRSCSATPPRC
jgi:hypothetical protein